MTLTTGLQYFRTFTLIERKTAKETLKLQKCYNCTDQSGASVAITDTKMFLAENNFGFNMLNLSVGTESGQF